MVNIPGGFKSFPWALHICKKILPQLNFVCRLLFGVRSNPLLPQWHEKEPGHSTNSAGGRLHLNMHEPLTQRSRSGLTRLLSRHSVGTYQEMSSHATHQGTLGQLSELAEPLWTDPGLKGGISVRELISTLKKKKKNAGGEWIVEHSPQILTCNQKSTTTTTYLYWSLLNRHEASAFLGHYHTHQSAHWPWRLCSCWALSVCNWSLTRGQIAPPT